MNFVSTSILYVTELDYVLTLSIMPEFSYFSITDNTTDEIKYSNLKNSKNNDCISGKR